MTPARLQIRYVIIDAIDPERLATFWSALLGRAIVGITGPYIWLASEDGLGIGFQRITQSQAGKNRIHLDLAADDPVAEQRRIESLGGRRLDEYRSGGFLVMADPEENEFCVIPTGEVDIDDDGRTDYLA